MTNAPEPPKLFISYSWTSPQHKQWVLELAKKLRSSGVDVILEKWNLKEGQDTITFMEGMVTDPTIDKVLIVVGKDYTEKANARESKVGTEAQIISKEIYENKGQEKFVALVLDKDENGKPYLPLYFQSRIYIDFSEPQNHEKEFEKLLRWIFDKPLYVKPDDSLSEYDEERQRNMDIMVEWFHENFEDPQNSLSYDKDDEYGYVWLRGGPCDASDELQENFPNEDYDIIEAAVEKIEDGGTLVWSPINGPEEHDDELLINDSQIEIDNALKILVNNAPKKKTAPAFAFGDNNQLYITDPPDNQPVDSQDDLLSGLRMIVDDLLQSLRGANFHQDMIPIIEKYKEAILGDEISISQLYWCGIRLDNVVQVIKRGIEAKEQPSLSLKTESNLNSVLELHGTYIMLNTEGQRLLQATASYNQSHKQKEEVKQASKQLADNITNNAVLFDKKTREYFNAVLMDIGQGQHPERSNQSAGNTLTNFVYSILVVGGTATIMQTIGGAVTASVPGSLISTLTTDAINSFWYFLINNAFLLQIIAPSLAGEQSWLVSAAHLLERIRRAIKSD